MTVYMFHCYDIVFYGRTAPTQSPTQVFTTDVQSESVMVHWTYDEFPRTGKLRAFQLNFYFPDENDPDRLGTQVPENSLTRLGD